MKDISTVAMLGKLKKEVKALGGTNKAADKWGVFPQQVSNALSGHALPSPKMLKVMKLKSVKQIKYRYKEVS
jgi:hypothetical protein